MTYNNPFIGTVAGNTGGLSALGKLFESYIGYAGQGLDSMAASAGVDRESRAARAGAEAADQYASARGAALREQARMGVNPNSGRFAGLEQKWELAEAAARSGAMQAAWEAADKESFSRASSLAQMGERFGSLAMHGAEAAAANDRSAASLFSDALRMQYDVDKNIAEGRGYRDAYDPNAGATVNINLSASRADGKQPWRDLPQGGERARLYQQERDAGRKRATLRPGLQLV